MKNETEKIIDDLIYKEICQDNCVSDTKYPSDEISCGRCEYILKKGIWLGLKLCKKQLKTDTNGFFTICRLIDEWED
jgi:hypothetical protein